MIAVYTHFARSKAKLLETLSDDWERCAMHSEDTLPLRVARSGTKVAVPVVRSWQAMT